MVRGNNRVFEDLIGSAERIDVPRSCALVIQAITLVCTVTSRVEWPGIRPLARLLAPCRTDVHRAHKACFRSPDFQPTGQSPSVPRSPKTTGPPVSTSLKACPE